MLSANGFARSNHDGVSSCSYLFLDGLVYAADMNKIFQILLLSLCLLLVGCFSSEPSESELFQAVVNYTNANPFAKAFNVRILRTKKLSCSKVGSNEYICLVEGTATTNVTGPITKRERYQLIKIEGRWEMIDNLH